MTGLHPETNAIIVLFHPRLQTWTEHFQWSEDQIEGLTDVGKVTVRVLNLNSDIRIQVRMATGYHEV